MQTTPFTIMNSTQLFLVRLLKNMTQLQLAPTRWEKGLLSCLDAPAGPSGCVKACFCPCLVSAEIAEFGGSSWCYGCLCTCACSGCIRRDARRVLGVDDGNLCEDCCTSLLCPVCALAQVRNEMLSRAPGDGSRNLGIEAGQLYNRTII